jgi:hypothetical protein
VSRAIYVVLGVLAGLCFVGAMVVGVASSVAPSLARGPAHAHAIGWAALLMGVMFFCGTTRSVWSGFIDIEDVHFRRLPTFRFTASDDPGPFTAYIVLYYAFGIALTVFGVYRLRH